MSGLSLTQFQINFEARHACWLIHCAGSCGQLAGCRAYRTIWLSVGRGLDYPR
jgi:hypothetical protein